MKLKQRPEDFQVEELTDIEPAASGPFAFYRLEKAGWGTPEAVQAVLRRWKLDRRRLSFGGLKDRHALTKQYFTVLHGPRRRLTHHTVRVEYLGQLHEPYTSNHIRANRFHLTLRALSEAHLRRAGAGLAEVRADGLANYFDDQRFGSVSAPGQFFARSLLRADYEDALRLALAAPYTHDRAAQKREKALLREHWNDWTTCKQQLPRGHARSLVDYLASHPGDFKGAVARIRPDLRSLYLSAYQSYLWNRTLAHWLRSHLPPEQRMEIRLRFDAVPFPRHLDQTAHQHLAATAIPLPSARLDLADDDPRRRSLEHVLAEEGIQPSQFRLKGLRDMFFSRGDRPAVLQPAALQSESGPDEHNSGRHKLVLSFDLPRGSYATLLVKRIMAPTANTAT